MAHGCILYRKSGLLARQAICSGLVLLCTVNLASYYVWKLHSCIFSRCYKWIERLFSSFS